MDIIFYTTNCPKCRVLKAKLAQYNIKYTEFTDVKEMISMGITSAPMLRVNGEMKNFKEAIEWLEEQRNAN